MIIKQGDTLALAGKHTYSDGTPYDLTNVTIESSIKIATMIVPFTVFKFDQTVQPGEFTLTILDTVTATLPEGRYSCDLKFTESGVITRTDTFSFMVEEAITQ